MKRLFRITIWTAGSIVAVLALLVTTCLLLNYRTASPTALSQSRLLSSPPEPLNQPVTLKIVTFNIWDLYYGSTHRPLRMGFIGSTLAALEPDVAGFQEAFIAKDRQIILDALADAGLPHAMYFPSGLVGSGLLVVSRYPIEEAFFHRYTEGGKPCKVHHGDWWAGKGACVVRLRLPGGLGCLDFFNTHAHAQYNSSEYDGVRMSQMKELAAFINAATVKTAPAIAVGDYNVEPTEPGFHTLVEEAGLERMMTLDTRIDHIFAVGNDLYTFDVVETVPIKKAIGVPGGSIGLSDHTGYMSTIRIQPAARN